MATDRLEQVANRLESVAAKLETIAMKGGSGGGADSGEAFVEAFDTLLTGSLASFVEISAKIHDDVKEAATLLQTCFFVMKETLKIVAQSKKPQGDKLTAVLKPLSDAIESVKSYCSKKFKSDYKSHLDAVSSFVVCLAWMPVLMKPHCFIKDTVESGTFYSNRVLTAFKDKGPDHKTWVQALIKVFSDLQQYTEDWHATGCAWNVKGKDADVPSASAASSQAKAAAPVAAKPSGGAAPSMGALFSDLNKGTGITTGLKKVDDTQKTHKNPNLRAGCTVTGGPSAAGKAPSSPKPEAVKPPVFELQGKKWVIENQVGVELMEVKEGDKSYSISLYRCSNTSIKVTPKINSVSMENCTNCQIQFMSGLISSCEITNSKKITVYATALVPFVTIDKSSEVNVHLQPESMTTKVATSCSHSVNVCADTANNDTVEHPVHYQFVSYFKDGKLLTEVSESV